MTLVTKLDAARLVGSRNFAGKYAFDESDHAYETAFREAGVWLPGDAPEVVAARIKASPVSLALVNAFDSWAGLTEDTDVRKERYLEISRLADPDLNGWRKRTQDLRIAEDKAALEQVAKDIVNSPATDPRVSLFMEFADRCRKAGIDPSPMLKKFHRT